MHLTSSPVDWYAARAAGIAAYVILTVVIALGLALSSRVPGRRWAGWPMFAVQDVHRTGGLFVGALIAVHVGTIAIDSFLPFSAVQLVVPFAAGYRPLWTGVGIAAAELLLALAVTNHYRSRLPYRWWRGAHYANFAVWTAATVHGLGAGTDSSAPWMVTIYATATGAVCSLVVWRRAARRGVALRRGLAVIPAGAVVLVVALALGPLHSHRKPWNAAVFHDHLHGRILQQQGASLAMVSMTGVGQGAQSVLVRADLLVGVDRLRATTFELEYLPSGTVCRGKVTRVQSYGFSGVCHIGHAGRHVTASWRPADGGGLTGTLDVRA
ncbi:MAG TPA: hypothetical protein VGC71_13560 [Gaiellales bacterium]|jgi:sulfoxide reductase heme-binding subunit YedZ